jgi:hypothetical protein
LRLRGILGLSSGLIFDPEAEEEADEEIWIAAGLGIGGNGGNGGNDDKEGPLPRV